MVEFGKASLFAMAKMSAIVALALSSTSLPARASALASSNLLAMRCASRRSRLPVLRYVRRPSGRVKHTIQNGELDNLRNDAIILQQKLQHSPSFCKFKDVNSPRKMTISQAGFVS
jgi:hypothetical protein